MKYLCFSVICYYRILIFMYFLFAFIKYRVSTIEYGLSKSRDKGREFSLCCDGLFSKLCFFFKIEIWIWLWSGTEYRYWKKYLYKTERFAEKSRFLHFKFSRYPKILLSLLIRPILSCSMLTVVAFLFFFLFVFLEAFQSLSNVFDNIITSFFFFVSI